jgi:VWFA-related protein
MKKESVQSEAGRTRIARGAGASRRTVGRLLALCLALPLDSFLASGGSPQDQPKPEITSVVKAVNVLATVRNTRGDLVTNLTKSDFILEEDDHTQTINDFVAGNDLPLTLGLLVDTSRSQRHVLGGERGTSYNFLDHVLREDKDKAFVIHFDHEVEMLQDVTSSHNKLQKSLDLLDTSDNRDSGSGPYGRGSRGEDRGSLLYDAVFLASDEVMKKQRTRRALIILSDGVDGGSKESLEDAIEAAQRSNTLVYSVLFADEDEHRGGGFGGPRIGMGGGGPMGGGGGQRRPPQAERPDGKGVLTQVSKETGARLYEVSRKLPIDKIFAQIQEELRSQYSLGFAPEGMDAAAGYHKLQLTTKQKDLVVQARDGFWADR